MVPQPPFNDTQSMFFVFELCTITSLHISYFSICVCFFLDDNVLAEAKRRYDIAAANGGERLISGSDDFTLFLWTPESSKTSVGNIPY